MEDATRQLALADEHARDPQRSRALVELGVVRPRAPVDVVDDEVALALAGVGTVARVELEPVEGVRVGLELPLDLRRLGLLDLRAVL